MTGNSNNVTHQSNIELLTGHSNAVPNRGVCTNPQNSAGTGASADPAGQAGAVPLTRVARNQSIIDTVNRAFSSRSAPRPRTNSFSGYEPQRPATNTSNQFGQGVGSSRSCDGGSEVAQVLDVVNNVGEFMNRFSTSGSSDPRARHIAERVTRAIASAMDLPYNIPPGPPQIPVPNCETSRDMTESDSDNEEPCSSPGRRVRFEKGAGQTRQHDGHTRQHDQHNDRNSDYAAAAPSQVPHLSSQRSADSLSVADLLQLLTRMDHRPVPKPDRYTWQGGRNLEQFLLQFQNYCEGTFRGDSSLWVGELSSLLTGDVKEVLESVWTYGMSFSAVKEELLKWASTQTKHRDQEARFSFSTARLREGEALGRYCLRLEALFKVAYPRKVQYLETSSTLRKKLFDTVSADFRAELRTAQLVQESLTQLGRGPHASYEGNELGWSAIKSLAARYDTNLQVEEPVREVWRTRYDDSRSSMWSTQQEELSPGDQWQGVSRQPVAARGFEFWSSQPTDRGRPRQRRASVSNSRAQPVLTGSNTTPVGDRRQHAPAVSGPPRGSSSNGRSRSQSATRSSGWGQTCSFCRRGNHTYENCRRRKRECLFCASPNHFIRECELAAERFGWIAPANHSSAGNRPPSRDARGLPPAGANLPQPLEPAIVQVPLGAQQRNHQGNL